MELQVNPYLTRRTQHNLTSLRSRQKGTEQAYPFIIKIFIPCYLRTQRIVRVLELNQITFKALKDLFTGHCKLKFHRVCVKRTCPAVTKIRYSLLFTLFFVFPLLSSLFSPFPISSHFTLLITHFSKKKLNARLETHFFH